MNGQAATGELFTFLTGNVKDYTPTLYGLKTFLFDGNTETIILHHGDLVNSVAQQQKRNLLAADHSSQDKRTMMYKKIIRWRQQTNPLQLFSFNLLPFNIRVKL